MPGSHGQQPAGNPRQPVQAAHAKVDCGGGRIRVVTDVEATTRQIARRFHVKGFGVGLEALKIDCSPGQCLTKCRSVRHGLEHHSVGAEAEQAAEIPALPCEIGLQAFHQLNEKAPVLLGGHLPFT